MMNRSLHKNNTSGIMGVYFNKKRDKWVSRINAYRKHINLGEFKDKEDAIKARLKAEKEYFGEFAPQKDLFKEYNIE
jgi:hypothetical protein